MDDLMLKLAKVLDMSVEGVIEYYPMIKSQLILYNSLGVVIVVLYALLMISPIAVVVGYMIADTFHSCPDDLFNKRNIKVAIAFFIFLFLLITVLSILRNVLAGDLIMLNKFL